MEMEILFVLWIFQYNILWIKKDVYSIFSFKQTNYLTILLTNFKHTMDLRITYFYNLLISFPKIIYLIKYPNHIQYQRVNINV